MLTKTTILQEELQAGKQELTEAQRICVERAMDRYKEQFQVRFYPPTIEEVRDYCLTRQNRVDAQRFVDFYTTKGWMVGKNKMKDWRAAVRTWERNDNNNKQTLLANAGTQEDHRRHPGL